MLVTNAWFSDTTLDDTALELFELHDQRSFIGEFASLLILAGLREFFEFDGEWEWTRSVMDIHCIMAYKARLELLAQALSSTHVPSASDRHEIDVIVKAAKGLRNPIYAISLSGIRAMNQHGQAVLEFDGIALSIDESQQQLVLTVSEAKKMHSSSTSTAIRDLRKKFSIISRRSGVIQSSIRTGSLPGAAWRHLRAPIGRRK